MTTKSRKRKEGFDQRDSKKFFAVVGIAVLVLMLLMFLMYKNMG